MPSITLILNPGTHLNPNTHHISRALRLNTYIGCLALRKRVRLLEEGGLPKFHGYVLNGYGASFHADLRLWDSGGTLLDCPGGLSPKGPCTQIVYTLALKYSIYRYIAMGQSIYYLGTWTLKPYKP